MIKVIGLKLKFTIFQLGNILSILDKSAGLLVCIINYCTCFWSIAINFKKLPGCKYIAPLFSFVVLVMEF